MMHTTRHHTITDIDTLAELADKLTQHSWTTCTGFRFEGLLFLNDSTGPDGAQEYTVVREHDAAQLESLTCSWMTQDEFISTVRRILTNTEPTTYGRHQVRQHPSGYCSACA